MAGRAGLRGGAGEEKDGPGVEREGERKEGGREEAGREADTPLRGCGRRGEAAMPLYEGLGSGGEKTAVVIDLGEAFTK